MLWEKASRERCRKGLPVVQIMGRSTVGWMLPLQTSSALCSRKEPAVQLEARHHILLYDDHRIHSWLCDKVQLCLCWGVHQLSCQEHS